MKKIFTLSIMLCMALIANAQVWDGTTKAEVTPVEGVYHVTTAAELAWIAEQSNAGEIDWNIVLDNDIDLGGKKWTPIGLANYFNGNFDGQGHTISNIYLNPAASDVCCGLIGQMNKSTATVKNFTLTGEMKLTGAYTTSNCDYATIVGLINALGSLENVHSYVNIDATAAFKVANYLGGLSARAKAVAISQCSYSGAISIGASTSFGKGWSGMVTTFNTGTAGATASMTGCWFDGSITSTATAEATYGGAFIGYAKISTLAMDANYCVGALTATTAPKSFGIYISNKDSGTQLVCKGENVTGVKSTNYSSTDYEISKYAATKFTTEEYHNGALAYNLNDKSGLKMFGQDMSNVESHPVVYADSIAVFRTTYIAGENTTVKYNNHTLIFPDDPKSEGMDFAGWFDSAEGGTQFTDATEVNSDLTLYAHFKQPTGIESIQSSIFNPQSSTYNLQGVRVGNGYKGIVVKDGKKYIK